MITITTKDATTGEVLYQGRSEAKARRVFDTEKSNRRVMLLVNGQPWQIAHTPAVKTPAHQGARGMHSS